MAIETFQYQYSIAAPAGEIYAHLAEPSNYIGLSPLVVRVDNITYATNQEGHRVCSYDSVEMFRFLGFIHYPNRIRVTTIFTQPDEQMISQVNSFPDVHVRFVFDFQAQGDETLITETVTIRMPWFVRGFVVSQAKAVQRARAEILRGRMEKGG